MVLVLIGAWYCRAAATGTADSDSQQFCDQVLQYLRQIAAHSMHGTAAPAGTELDRTGSGPGTALSLAEILPLLRAGNGFPVL